MCVVVMGEERGEAGSKGQEAAAQYLDVVLLANVRFEKKLFHTMTLVTLQLTTHKPGTGQSNPRHMRSGTVCVRGGGGRLWSGRKGERSVGEVASSRGRNVLM